MTNQENTIRLARYQVRNVQRARICGQEMKTFVLYELVQGAFVCIGTYAAPASIPNGDLWKHGIKPDMESV